MMAVGLTSTPHLAAVVSSAFYSLWNLMSGFLVPKPVSTIFLNSTLIRNYSICVCLRNFLFLSPLSVYWISVEDLDICMHTSQEKKVNNIMFPLVKLNDK